MDPPRTMTFAGVRAMSTTLLENVTTNPPAGASRVNVTPPSAVPRLGMEVGATISDASATGSTGAGGGAGVGVTGGVGIVGASAAIAATAQYREADA